MHIHSWPSHAHLKAQTLETQQGTIQRKKHKKHIGAIDDYQLIPRLIFRTHTHTHTQKFPFINRINI